MATSLELDAYAIAGAVGAVAAVCVGILFQQHRAHKQKGARDGLLLAKMQRLPLVVSEHADCRMDCRCVQSGPVSRLSMYEDVVCLVSVPWWSLE